MLWFYIYSYYIYIFPFCKVSKKDDVYSVVLSACLISVDGVCLFMFHECVKTGIELINKEQMKTNYL